MRVFHMYVYCADLYVDVNIHMLGNKIQIQNIKSVYTHTHTHKHKNCYPNKIGITTTQPLRNVNTITIFSCYRDFLLKTLSVFVLGIVWVCVCVCVTVCMFDHIIWTDSSEYECRQNQYWHGDGPNICT